MIALRAYNLIALLFFILIIIDHRFMVSMSRLRAIFQTNALNEMHTFQCAGSDPSIVDVQVVK